MIWRVDCYFGTSRKRFERLHYQDFDDVTQRWVWRPKGRISWRGLVKRYRSHRRSGINRLSCLADCLYVRYWWQPLEDWAYDREKRLQERRT